jgi:hypothetical protein
VPMKLADAEAVERYVEEADDCVKYVDDAFD